MQKTEIFQKFNINGFLLLNKPSNISSFFCLMKIKKLFLDFLSKNNIEINKISKNFIPKIGHVGTLDPLASGLLVVLLGDATKLANLFQNHKKEYIAKIKIGLMTDTYDINGNLIKETKTFFSKNDLENILNFFIGYKLQEVPIYSAVSVNGKRLYEYAREGKKVKLPKKEVFIENIDLLNFDERMQTFSIKVKCSKGTYIRALANDIGEKLGSFATLIELKRTKIGDICLEDSKKLDEIKNILDLKENIISIEKYLLFFKLEKTEKIVINDEEVKKVLNGNFSFLKNKKIYYNSKYELYHKDKILCILDVNELGKLKSNFIFRNNLDVSCIRSSVG